MKNINYVKNLVEKNLERELSYIFQVVDLPFVEKISLTKATQVTWRMLEKIGEEFEKTIKFKKRKKNQPHDEDIEISVYDKSSKGKTNQEYAEILIHEENADNQVGATQTDREFKRLPTKKKEADSYFNISEKYLKKM